MGELNRAIAVGRIAKLFNELAMMKFLAILVAVSAITSLIADDEVFATDIPVLKTVRTAAHHRHIVVRHAKLIGMPCVLPPDVIVARNWNGPQCRYVDNIIL